MSTFSRRGVLPLFLLGGLLSAATLVGCGLTASTVGDDVERRVHVLDDVDEAPRIVGGYQALEEEKRYPEQARREGAVGVIWVQCRITARGQPTQIRFAQGGHSALESEARRVVSEMRFEPARLQGATVPATVQIPVIFDDPSGDED